MQHFRSLDDIILNQSWLTIGTFDGVHRGHQEIVRGMTAGARSIGAPAVVLTFFPHPGVVLGKRDDHTYLTTPEDRANLLGELGVDIVITHPFTPQIAAMTARQFIAYLSSRLGLRMLWVGYDFALGRGREGNVATLMEIGKEFGYRVQVIPPVIDNGEIVSSSNIRSTLASGDVVKAAQMLGRPYHLRGKVVSGDGRGRRIGIPTANLEVWSELTLPKSGVYTCRAWVNTQRWGAVTNVGVRPTFTPDSSVHVEAHLLDFQEDLYGQEVCLEFISRLRDEQRFPDVQSLVAQIHQDIAQARKVLT
jgi:riboflavin kinase/FMN adenylyltransferase